MSYPKLRPETGSAPSRLWFMSKGYSKADPRYTNGKIVWLHPETNTVLTKYGTKLKLNKLPRQRYHMVVKPRYLALPGSFGNMLLARLKYLTFKGEIKPGYVIDHIDGNTFNNNIRNLRAVPRSINDRDGGFMRKLRNNGYNVADFPGIILEGYERMAEWKKTHSKKQYEKLHKQDLFRVFVGPTFIISDPAIIDDLEPNKYYDPFIERN